MVFVIDGTIFEIKLNTLLIYLTCTYNVKFSEYKFKIILEISLYELWVN